MTKDKDEKAVIRARMAKTGESYATAKAQLAQVGEPTADADDKQAQPDRPLTARAAQAIGAADRFSGGPWVLLHTLRVTEGTAGKVLEGLGFPALTYDGLARLAAGTAAGPSPLDRARPLHEMAEKHPLLRLVESAGHLVDRAGRKEVDSGALLQTCVQTLQADEVPAAGRELLERLKGADLVRLCSEVEQSEGLESPPPLDRPGIFQRFTDRARVAIVQAQEEARQLGHNWIGTEHLLLGLLHEGGGLAAQVLIPTTSLEDMRAKVDELIGVRSDRPEGHIPFTPRAKTVLELALGEALALSHEHIGTEHILLGLSVEEQGLAAQLLVERGLTPEVVRAQVLALIEAVYPPRE